MNFLKALGSFVDALWALFTIPALLIAIIYGIGYFPIPTLIIMILFIWKQVIDARLMRGYYSIFKDREYKRKLLNCQIKAVLLVVCTIVAYWVYIRYTLNHGILCENTDGMIIGTLAEILQSILGKKCN